MKQISRYISILIFYSFNVIAQSDNKSIQFQNLNVNHGLSNSMVLSIARDSMGFMWIGTDNGLNRFDGLKVKEYNIKTGKESDQWNQAVTSLVVDKNGTLFIGAYYLYEYKKNSDSLIQVFKENSIAKTPERISAMCIAPDNTLWLVARNGLFSYQKQSRVLTHHPSESPPNYSESRSILFKNDKIWVGTKNKGLYVYNAKTENYKEIILKNINNKDVINITSLCSDEFGNIWVGTKNDGVYILDENTYEIKKYLFTTEGENKVRSIACSKNKQMWIGTYIGLFDVKFNKEYNFQIVKHNNISTTSLLIDKQEMLWQGSLSSGIYYSDLLNKSFYSYSLKTEIINTGNQFEVNGIIEDKDDNIYISVDKLGVLKLNEKFEIINTYKLNNSSLRGIAARCLTNDEFGNIWVGTEDGGVSEINCTNGKIRNFLFQNKNTNDNNISSILTDLHGKIWVATESAIYYVNIGTGECKHILSLGGLKSLYIDKKQRLWFTNSSDGVYKYDSVTLGFKLQFKNLNLFNVTSIYLDSKNHLWLGRRGELTIVNLTDTSSINIPRGERGISSQIFSIIEDQHNNMWISTSYGLIKAMNASEYPNNFSIRTFYEADGLTSSQFIRKSSYISHDSAIYFGTLNGFVKFYPDAINENPFAPDLFFTDLSISNQIIKAGTKVEGVLILPKALNELNELKLSYKHQFIRIGFAAGHYSNAMQNEYSYKLEPYQKDWVKCKAPNNYITFSSLPAGKYNLHVKAANADGIWSQKILALKIIVTPPFWETWWFRVLVLVSVFSLGFLAYIIRIRRVQKRQILLQKLIEERTAELTLMNEELRERQAIVMDQKEELLRQNEQLEELNSLKDKFFSIIAHDLRNPFQAVIGFSELLIKKYDRITDAKRKEYSEIIHNSSRRIYNLLENLLTWARTQTGSIVFEPDLINMNDLINKCHVLFKEQALHKNVILEVESEDVPEIQADINMLETTIRNLLSNAIKYTSANGQVVLSLKKENDNIIISVSDSGIGMDENTRKNLFKPGQVISKKGTAGEKGTGLGLLLCKEFVNKHNGQIWVENNFDRGSTFYITIPIITS